MLEKDIEKRVCEYATTRGFEVYKFISPSRRAVPDRIFLRNGHTFFIEFKREGAQATAPQKREHTRLQNTGFRVYVIDNIAAGLKAVDRELVCANS